MHCLPVILFEPDGYVLDGPKLMGRQVAGNSFLRAAVQAAKRYQKSPLLQAWTPHRNSADVFKTVVSDLSPEVSTGWVPTDRHDLLAQNGSLYLPGPGLADAARRRLRVGPSAWSLTGTTHTMCSHVAMDAIVDILAAPTMPWDALICTSTVAQNAAKTLFQLQAEYLAWRFGIKQFVVPQLPVIPLGVHLDDFRSTVDERKLSRKALGLASDDVAILFAGRLSFHAKAHPYPLLIALNQAAQGCKQRVVLLLCGQFPNEAVHQAFIHAAQTYAPHIRTQWVDGKDFGAYSKSWAGCDIFVSLSDNLQETFGLTPLEAMASGLPVLVSDWDGYKDTVVDGETGFRIPTWMPPPNVGTALAAAFEAGTINYDRYIGLACMEVSLDNDMLIQRLSTLISDPILRTRMGEAGRVRVAKYYDWSVVMDQHIDLWQELDRIRNKAQAQQAALIGSAPKCNPSRQDPYRVFASFPTHAIQPGTMVSIIKTQWPAPDWSKLLTDPLFSYAQDYLPKEAAVDQLLSHLNFEPISVGTLSHRTGISIVALIRALAPLAKVGLIQFQSPTI